MKTRTSALILGIGFFLCGGGPARAQLGDLGNAVKQGAADAAKQEMMKQVGLPTPGAAAATPGGDTGAATAPAGEPKAATPAAAAPGAETGAPNAPAGE